MIKSIKKLPKAKIWGTPGFVDVGFGLSPSLLERLAGHTQKLWFVLGANTKLFRQYVGAPGGVYFEPGNEDRVIMDFIQYYWTLHGRDGKFPMSIEEVRHVTQRLDSLERKGSLTSSGIVLEVEVE